MNFTSKLKPSFVLFAALPVLFFILFGFDGMDVADRGFIPAFADRILAGETVYQDFYYVRPPLTPYLHTFEMAIFPDALEMVAYRFFFYVFVWLSVLFSILALKRYFDFEKMGVSPWLLGSIGYLLAIHNFFAAPWHTVDGIVFASLGLLLISRGPKIGYLVGGLFCLGLAALAKQPFSVVPITGVALLFWLYPWKRAAIATALTLVLAGIGFVAIEYWLTPSFSFWAKMRAQTTGVTSFEEMKWSAFKLYVRPALVVAAAALLWYVLKRRLKLAATPQIVGALAFLGILLMAIGPLAITVQKGEFVMPKSGFYHGLLACGAMITVLSLWKRDRLGLAVLLAMLVISWASSVSWGYASPVLYSFPAIFALAYFTGTIAEFKAPRWFWPTALAICMACIACLNLYVYHDDFRTELTHDLGAVFTRLSHIDTGAEEYERYAELKTLHAKYGDAFTVLPSMPLAHYVTATKPRIKADWIHDGEINYQTGIAETVQMLDASKNFVFALKDEMGRADEQGTFRCSVLKHVITHWVRIDSTQEFWVYENLVPPISAAR
jgi:hypothetical protein